MYNKLMYQPNVQQDNVPRGPRMQVKLASHTRTVTQQLNNLAPRTDCHPTSWLIHTLPPNKLVSHKQTVTQQAGITHRLSPNKLVSHTQLSLIHI